MFVLILSKAAYFTRSMTTGDAENLVSPSFLPYRDPTLDFGVPDILAGSSLNFASGDRQSFPLSIRS